MTEPQRPGSREHDSHDRLLVIRLAAGDVSPVERELAERLTATCANCAGLAAEVESISWATSTSLPSARRTRDFRLTEERARRLRRSPLQDWLARIALPRLVRLQPLAGAAIAVGLVMAVVSSPGLVATTGSGAAGTASVADQAATAAPADAGGAIRAAAPEVASAPSAVAAAGGQPGASLAVTALAPASSLPKGPSETAGPVNVAATAPPPPPAPSGAPGPLTTAPPAGVVSGAGTGPSAAPAETAGDQAFVAAGSGASNAPARLPAAVPHRETGGSEFPAQVAWLLLAALGVLLLAGARLGLRWQRFR